MNRRFNVHNTGVFSTYLAAFADLERQSPSPSVIDGAYKGFLLDYGINKVFAETRDDNRALYVVVANLATEERTLQNLEEQAGRPLYGKHELPLTEQDIFARSVVRAKVEASAMLSKWQRENDGEDNARYSVALSMFYDALAPRFASHVGVLNAEREAVGREPLDFTPAILCSL